MRPTGKRIVPAAAGPGPCAEIGVAGPPVWSPDATHIAMPTRSGTYVMDADGRHLRLVTPESGLGTFSGRSWNRGWGHVRVMAIIGSVH